MLTQKVGIMRYTVLISFLLFSLSSWASVNLKVGDVLLQPLDCWSCTLIEDEEQTIYSHIGIVIAVNPVMVAESRGRVKMLSLEEFNSTTEKGQRISVRRFQNSKIVNELNSKSAQFLALFKNEFEGLKYDKAFLWDNFDEEGKQKLYCSEMVAKLLQAFLGIDPIVKRMHFSRNRERWERYFNGNVPVGKWGNAPADFERSNWFYEVGEI
jgi:hypothetical protein